MARSARGLPDSFALDLPDDGPVVIGDFLDEAPALPKPPRPRVEPGGKQVEPGERREIAKPVDRAGEEPRVQAPVARRPAQPAVIRYQLNLTPRSKVMLEELVAHVRTYSPQNDASTSEVFQGIMSLLHGVMNELDLADIPRRGAWGSVTAKNFPVALAEAFERAIVAGAKKHGRV